MRTLTASEVSRNFAAVLDRVERGETVVITRSGRRLATLRPADASNGAELVNALRTFRQRYPDDDPTFAEDVESARNLLTSSDPWRD